MADTSVFFYDIERLVHDAAASSIHLWGGRSLGKSTILRQMRKRLSPDAEIIEGTDAQARERLAIAVERKHFPIFIDDLDELLKRDLTPAAELLNKLSPYLAHQRVVFTSTLPPHLGLLSERGLFQTTLSPEDIRIWSSVTLQFDSHPVDPWFGDWRRRIEHLVARLLPERSDATRRIWAGLLTQLTAGHPVLLDAAIAELCNGIPPTDMAGEPARTPQQGNQPSGEEALFTVEINERQVLQARVEEALFRTGLRRLRRVYLELRETVPRAYSALTALARGEVSDVSTDVRDALLWSGLVITDGSGLLVAGELLQRALLEASVTDSIQLLPAPDPNDPRGVVRVMVGGAWRVVELRGAAWQILSVLHAHRDRVLSVTELMTLTKFENEAAFRSALQRLRAEFLRFGVDGIFSNVWGYGYSFSGRPLLVMPVPTRTDRRRRSA